MDPSLDRLLNPEETREITTTLPRWACKADKLSCVYEFSDFRSAMAFMLLASYAAEELVHHPNWNNVYKRVDVQIWSHDRGGVTRRCVRLAQAFDRAAAQISK